MPIVTIWNVPYVKEEKLRSLSRYIKEKSFGLSALSLNDDDITILFPENKLKADEGKDIVVQVSGLFYKPERTQGVLNSLARWICVAITNHFHDCKVRCFVEIFDQHRQGFVCEDHRDRK